VSDDDRPGAENNEQPLRRPSPTSRARRIGGRPTPQPAGRPQPAVQAQPTPQPTPPPAAVQEQTRLDKPPAASAPQPTGTRRADAVRWVPAGILAAAAIVLFVLLAVASHGVYWAKSGDSTGARADRQEQVLAAAKKCFATVNTYDYRTLSGLMAKDLPCATGKFKSDLQQALQKTIVPQAPKQKAVQNAQVNKAGIVAVTPDGEQWTTLIYGQLTQSNATTAKSAPRTDLFGAVVTMDHVGGKYLISKVDFDAGNGLGG
jgi:hypothetical protein